MVELTTNIKYFRIDDEKPLGKMLAENLSLLKIGVRIYNYLFIDEFNSIHPLSTVTFTITRYFRNLL